MAMCYVYETIHKIQYKLLQYMILDRANFRIHSPDCQLKLPAVNMLKSWPVKGVLPDKKPQSSTYSSKLNHLLHNLQCKPQKNHYRPITRKFSTSFTFLDFKNMLFVRFLSGDWREGCTTANILFKMDMCSRHE